MSVGAVDKAGRISIMEAVSWIAYGDFDASKNEVIPCNSPPTKSAIGESIEAFRKKISEAEKQLLLKVRGGNLLVYGVPYGSNGDNLILIPLDKLEAAGIKLNSPSNRILRYTKDDRPIKSSMWMEVEVRKEDVVQLWPTTASLLEKADDTVQANGMQLSPPPSKTNTDDSRLLPSEKSSDDRLNCRPDRNQVREILREIYNEAPSGSKPHSADAETLCRKRIAKKFTKAAGKDNSTREDLIRLTLREEEFRCQRNKAGKRLKS